MAELGEESGKQGGVLVLACLLMAALPPDSPGSWSPLTRLGVKAPRWGTKVTRSHQRLVLGREAEKPTGKSGLRGRPRSPRPLPRRKARCRREGRGGARLPGMPGGPWWGGRRPGCRGGWQGRLAAEAPRGSRPSSGGARRPRDSPVGLGANLTRTARVATPGAMSARGHGSPAPARGPAYPRRRERGQTARVASSTPTPAPRGTRGHWALPGRVRRRSPGQGAARRGGAGRGRPRKFRTLLPPRRLGARDPAPGGRSSRA